MCHNAMKDVSYDTPLFENPLTVVSKIARSFGDELVDRLPRRGIGEWFSETFNQMSKSGEFSSTDLKHVIYIAVGLTILRYIVNAVLLKRIPGWVKMTKENAIKFPESTFNATMYGIAWVWELYIFSTSPKNLFFNLAAHWHDWEKGSQVEPQVYWLLMFQLGFYLHFLYATVFVNTKRKDFAVLVLHHVLTITLIAWSYAVRFHYVGLVLLFLHDIGDVLLEVGKSCKYFEVLDGKKFFIADLLANVLFGVFTLEWILCRLYWYPMKVLQSSAVVSMMVCPKGVFYLPFNVMLAVLYLMQVYWFYFILKLLYKVLIKRESVDDNREYDVEDKSKKKEEVKKKE